MEIAIFCFILTTLFVIIKLYDKHLSEKYDYNFDENMVRKNDGAGWLKENR